MKLKQLSQILLLTSCVWLWGAISATAQEILKKEVQSKSVASLLRNSLSIRQIRQLSDLERPSTSAQQLLVQSPTPSPGRAPQVVPITSVKANPTDKGVEIILETLFGTQLQVINRSTGNNFIVDVSGGQLRLPDGNAFTFRSEKPSAGITEITVTNVDANTVRVTVVGVAALPTVELFDDNAGLVFGIASAKIATSPPQQPEKPASETPQDEPAAQQDEPIELVVTGEQDGYRVPNASTATKTDTPLRDIPQSIQVVPQQVIRDQQATRIEDALKNVPGVTQRSGLYSSVTNFTIRGFDAGGSGNVLRDGLFDSAGSVTGQGFGTDLFNIDRVEVLKGPASVLYGSAAPGGTVNLVTKKPLRDPFYQVEATIGNYDFYSGRVDLSGPLNDSKSVLYRLNVGYENSGSFINFFDRQSLSISPSLSFRLGDRTNLTLQGEYASIDAGSYVGLPTVGTVFPNPNGKIPRSFNSGEPSDFVRTENSRIGYRLDHQFSDNWSLRNAFQVKFSTLDVDAVVARSLDSDNRTLNRIRVLNEGDGETYILTTDLIGNFSTGSIKHQLLVGFDWNSDNATYTRRSRRTGVPSLDIFDPIYNQPQAEEPFEIDFSSNYGSDSLGIYIQDLVSLTSNLKLLLGLRYDTQDYNFRDLTSDFRYSQADSAFSPRVGIVYQPIPPISLYASYARSFTPSLFGNSVDGRPFKPGRGTQYEVGVKADLSNRLSATLAFYDLTRTNVSTNDPNNLGFSIQTGEQRSRGIEFNIGGEILPGLNVIAGYSYIDAQISKDNVFTVGNRLNDVPYNSFNLWTTYQIQQGSLQGLGFGLGLFYVGERQGDLDNTPTYVLPSYFRTDAAIFYQRGRYRAALNFTNLFNVNYFEGTGDFELIAGAPFTVRGTLSWEF